MLVRQEALPFGIAAWRLGAGRARQQDPVQHAAGIDLHAKPGDAVTAGQPLFTMHTHDTARFERALEALDGAWEIGDPGTDSQIGWPTHRRPHPRLTAARVHSPRPAPRPRSFIPTVAGRALALETDVRARRVSYRNLPADDR